ncbi:MAG: hypothetical protein IT436_18485 [Phycisphaerales bacterium]|nr:hypothetical protein [Phycisphaerales bacterium]
MRSELMAVCAGAVMISGAARAQVYSWAVPVSGDWGVASNWTPAVVPHGPGVEARLELLGPYTVSFGGVAYAVGRYTASNPEAVLRMDPPPGDSTEPTLLSVFGHMTNDGLIRLAGDPAREAGVRIQVNGVGYSLMGSGELRMEEAGDTEIVLMGAGDFLHGAGHSITGEGTIQGSVLTFINEGLISADRPGGLTFSARAENRAVMRAVGAGTLVLSGDRITQTGAGVIEADGAPVVFSPGEVWGGTVRSINGGRVEIAAGSSAEVSDVTAAGEWVILPSPTVAFTTLHVRYGLTNDGLIRVTGRSSTMNNTRLEMLDAGVIGGTGEIRLEEAGDTELFLSRDQGAVTNGAGHTISGVGMIHSAGMELRNAGILAPGAPLGTLLLYSRAVMEPTSVVKIELGGDAPEQRDHLDATGHSLTLDGVLSVAFRDDYVLPPCSSFVVVSGELSGTFAVHDLPEMPQGLISVVYGADAVTIGYIPGDLNGDGLLDFGDYLQFLNLYDAQDSRADLNGDGLVDFSDYLEFLNLYEAGC